MQTALCYEGNEVSKKRVATAWEGLVTFLDNA